VALESSSAAPTVTETGSASPGTFTNGTVTVPSAPVSAKASLIVAERAFLNVVSLFNEAAVVPVGTENPTVKRPNTVVVVSVASSPDAPTVTGASVDVGTHSVTLVKVVVVVLSVEFVVVTFCSVVTFVQEAAGATVVVVTVTLVELSESFA